MTPDVRWKQRFSNFSKALLDTSARFGLSGSVIDKIHGVLMRHPSILRAVIYGSRAKGNFRPGERSTSTRLR